MVTERKRRNKMVAAFPYHDFQNGVVFVFYVIVWALIFFVVLRTQQPTEVEALRIFDCQQIAKK